MEIFFLFGAGSINSRLLPAVHLRGRGTPPQGLEPRGHGLARSSASYSRVTRSRSALPTTLTDDSAIAAAAMIGDSRMPKAG